MRLHLDEHVSPAIAIGLRRRGVDVTTTLEAGLRAASDEEQLRYATAQGRVVFTHDADFLRLHKRRMAHAGIVYCHQGQYSVGEVVRRLTALAHRRRRTDIRNQVESLCVVRTPMPRPPPACVGDCSGNGQVTDDELMTMVDITLGAADAASCPSGLGAEATVTQIAAAVNNALNGCPGS